MSMAQAARNTGEQDPQKVPEAFAAAKDPRLMAEGWQLFGDKGA